MAKKQCDVCRKRFSTYQGLGGHMSGPCGYEVKARPKAKQIRSKAHTGTRTSAGPSVMVKATVSGPGFGKNAAAQGLPAYSGVSVTGFAEPGILKPVAETILEEAQRLVHGERNKDYGHPLDDFSRTGEMATGLFRTKLRPGAEITAEDVGMFMILIKLSRQMNRPKRDNMVDTAGYAGTVQMCVEEAARRKGE